MNTMENEPLSGRSMTENNKTEYKAHYHLPGLLNSTSCTRRSCHYTVSTGNIFTTGVISVQCMVHRVTASGAVAEWDMVTAVPEMCWNL